MANRLMCGVGRADITPPLGTILYGYAPGRPAESVGDELNVTAIMVTSEKEKVLLISCTLCEIYTELSLELRAMAGEAAGVRPENVVLNVTHTHSGPNTSVRSGWGEVDHPYIENYLKPGVVKAAREAVGCLRAAVVGFGEVDSDVGINRRELTEDGRIVLGQNPWAPRDMKMTVISFKGEDGAVIANMVHYSCHSTASGMNPEITRDWPGVMVDMLEEETGGVTAFFAGLEGDQGPNLPNGKTTGDYKMALKHGARAGADAVRAFRSIKEWRDVPLKVLHDRVRIPFDALPSREKAEAELARLGTLEQIYAEKRYPDVNEYLHWTGVMAEYESGRPLKTHWEFDQSIVTIGPAAIIPTPFEPFIEVGLRLRRHSPYRYTLSLCITHGANAYMPTLGEIERGGYEVWYFLDSPRTLYPLPRNTDDHWVKQNLKILREEELQAE